MAKKSVKKLTRVQVGDLIGSGAMGLFQAIENYEPWRNVRFENYCARRIRGAMLDGLRSEDIIPRVYRRRMKLIEKASEDLRQLGVTSPNDEEIRKALGMTEETFKSTKHALRAIPALGLPVKYQEDVRTQSVDTVALFKEVLRFAKKRLNRRQFRILTM